MSEVFGFLNIDKPHGLTSHDVVGKIRRGLRVKKVGHAGTLDPLATGVLVICLGAATRLSEYMMHTRKRYSARVRLGQATTTYDREGEITAQTDDIAHIEQAAVLALLPRFTGHIQQMPPVYSAIKRDGKKLYEMARAGEDVTLTPRPVTIHELTITAWHPPHFTLDVVCAAGTYIRSLAHDIGAALGVGAHLADLRRTASGALTTESALDLNATLENPDWEHSVIPPDVALAHIPALHLDDGDIAHIAHGRRPQSTPPPVAGASIARAHDSDGRLRAILRAERGAWLPHKVFHLE